jgi:hypothetical protein
MPAYDQGEREASCHGRCTVAGPGWAPQDRSPDTASESGEQLGALRCWVGVTIVTHPLSPCELFDTTYGEYPRAPRDSEDGLGYAVEGAAEPVRTCIDTIQADATLRINAYQQRQVRGDDTRERIRRGDHEHNDHLRPRGLLYVCAIQNCAHHHAWNCDDARHADQGKR